VFRAGHDFGRSRAQVVGAIEEYLEMKPGIAKYSLILMLLTQITLAYNLSAEDRTARTKLEELLQNPSIAADPELSAALRSRLLQPEGLKNPIAVDVERYRLLTNKILLTETDQIGRFRSRLPRSRESEHPPVVHHVTGSQGETPIIDPGPASLLEPHEVATDTATISIIDHSRVQQLFSLALGSIAPQTPESFVPPSLDKCLEDRTVVVELAKGSNEAPQGISDILFIANDPWPDSRDYFGPQVKVYKYSNEPGELLSFVASKMGVSCLPSRIRRVGKTVHLHEGLDALRNFSGNTGSANRLHPYIQALYGRR